MKKWEIGAGLGEKFGSSSKIQKEMDYFAGGCKNLLPGVYQW